MGKSGVDNHRWVEPSHRFDGVLACVLMIYLAAFLPSLRVSMAITSVCLGGAWLWIFKSEGRHRFAWLVRVLTLVCAGLILGGSLVAEPNSLARGIILLVIAGALFALPLVILDRVLHHRRVTVQTVYGAICIYLLIGEVFALLYTGVDEIWPGTVLAGTSHGGDERGLGMYFSFVVLSSLGFGDVYPQSAFAKAVVPLETVLGQVFLATLVARTVALFGQRKED